MAETIVEQPDSVEEPETSAQTPEIIDQKPGNSGENSVENSVEKSGKKERKFDKSKLGCGYSVSVHLKKCISKRYRELVEKNKLIEKQRDKINIIEELCDTYLVSKTTVKKFMKTEPKEQTLPVKKGRKLSHFNYNSNDFGIIDKINCELIRENYSTITNIKKRVDSDPDCQLSFKDSGQSTFYRLIRRMGYKYSQTKKRVVRTEPTKSEIKEKPAKKSVVKNKLKKN